MISVSTPFFLALMFMATVGPIAALVIGASFGGPMTTHDGSPEPLRPSIEDARALRRAEAARDRALTDLPDPLSDEELEAAESAWVQSQSWLSESLIPFSHLHGDGHSCTSDACALMGKDHLCVHCQLFEQSDRERHRAKTRGVAR